MVSIKKITGLAVVLAFLPVMLSQVRGMDRDRLQPPQQAWQTHGADSARQIFNDSVDEYISQHSMGFEQIGRDFTSGQMFVGLLTQALELSSDKFQAWFCDLINEKLMGLTF